MKKGVIYCYHCIPTGKKYIGQTIDEKTRKKKHISDSNILDLKFYRAVRKYGWENFIYGIISEFDENILNEKEMFYVEKYGSFENGYNSTLGGGGKRGYKSSQETRELLSKLKKGKPINHGKSVSAALTGRKLSKEHNEKIQKVLKENKLGIFSMSHEDLSLAGKKGGKLGGIKGAEKQHKQKWKCLITGHISSPCGLSSYQRARGIDKSMRVRLE
jgi:group I intron endonuclease